jgi:hypothetical protein
MSPCSESAADIFVVMCAADMVARSVASPVVIGLCHLHACVDIHPVWCIHYIFPDILVTVDILMLRSLRLGLTGPIRRWWFV